MATSVLTEQDYSALVERYRVKHGFSLSRVDAGTALAAYFSHENGTRYNHVRSSGFAGSPAGVSGQSGDSIVWWTQTGERVLTGAEAELFGYALGVVLDEVEEAHRDAQSEDDEWTASLTAFDDLTYGQKIQVFATVAEGLLLPEVPKVPLTAAVEAGVAAIYEQLKTYVEMEIDAEDLPDEDEQDRQRRETSRHFWRRKILAVCAQYGMQEPDPSDPESNEPVTESCADKEEWDFLIERIMELILWDRDYEDGNILLDLPPERAREMRELLAITPDYHQTIADDLTEKPAAAAIARIKQLLHKVAPD